MARKSSNAEAPITSVDDDALKAGSKALAKVAANAAQVAELVGYDLPYNQERVVQETRFYMEKSAEAMLEAGKRLLVLKENEQHGEFIAIVEGQLNLPARTAQQMMAASLKYLTNPALSGKASAFQLLGKSKMFELMTLGDDTLVELADGGSVAGLELDDIDRMTVRELKASLREMRDTSAATDQVLVGKNKKIDKLQAELERKKGAVPADEWAWQPARRQFLETGEQIVNFIQTELRAAIQGIDDFAATSGDLIPADLVELRGQVLGAIVKTLTVVQTDFAIDIDLESIVVPEWMQQDGE